MSDPRDGIKCGYGLYVIDVHGGNAKIRRDYPPGGVEIERADIPDVIAALQAVLDWRGIVSSPIHLPPGPDGEP